MSSAFQKYYGVRLALENAGSMHDEEIQVKLRIPADAWLSFSEMAKWDKKVLIELIDNSDCREIYEIPHSHDYLSYFDLNSSRHSIRFPIRSPFGCVNSGVDFEEEVANLFEGYYELDGDDVVIECMFQKIMPRTVIAFPEIIFILFNPKTCQIY